MRIKLAFSQFFLDKMQQNEIVFTKNEMLVLNSIYKKLSQYVPTIEYRTLNRRDYIGIDESSVNRLLSWSKTDTSSDYLKPFQSITVKDVESTDFSDTLP